MMEKEYLDNIIDQSAEDFYRSPMYKEIRLNSGNVASRRNLKMDLDHISESNESWTHADSEKSYQSQLAPLTKEKFYEFLKKKIPPVRKKAIFEEIRKGITFKIDEFPDDSRVSSCFEKVYTKWQTSTRQAKKNWTEEETTLLIAIVTLYCAANEDDFTSLSDETWFYFSSIFPGKKTDQIKHRWLSILRVNLSKAPWTKLEDEVLAEIMKTKSDKKPWRDVAAEVNQKSGSDVLRTGKQCRERWTNHLDPNINRGAWTEEEDMRLLQCFLLHGKRWSEISKLIDNRTENAVKNRFNSLMKKYQKDSSLANQNDNKGIEEDSIWERRIASLVLSSNGYSLNPIIQDTDTKQEIFSTNTGDTNSSPENVYQETASEGAKRRDMDLCITKSNSHTRNPSRVDQKKNLLKSIIQQEAPSGFMPLSQQSQFDHGQGNGMHGHSSQHMHNMYPTNQFASNFGTFGQNYQHQQQPQYQFAQSQTHSNQGMGHQTAGGSNYYGGFQNNQGQPGMSNTFSTPKTTTAPQSDSFGQFPNPLAGLPYFSGQRSSADLGHPLNSNNILGSNTINLPMSSPSILRTSNNPFFTAPTFPIDANPFKGANKSNSFSDESKDMKDSFQVDQQGIQIETPNVHSTKPTEIKREFIEKSLSEFVPETMIKPNSNKLMFGIVDYEKNYVYPINPVTFENYKPVMAAAKSNLGRDSLFASPLSIGSDFASPHLFNNAMEFNNITKLNGDFASLTIGRPQVKAQESPSLRYLNSLLTGKRINDSPDSFMSLRSPTLLGGSLGRRPISGQVNPIQELGNNFFKP